MIYRTAHQSNFSIRGNASLQDVTLSDSAYKLLHYLLSLPTDWTIYPKQLMKQFQWSRDKTYRALKELRDRGHAVLIRCRRSSIWKIYETPLTVQSDELPCVQIAEEPSNKAPSKIPCAKTSCTENTLQSNNSFSTKKEKTTTAATIIESVQLAEASSVVVSNDIEKQSSVTTDLTADPIIVTEVEKLAVTQSIKPTLIKTLAALTLAEAKAVLNILARAIVLGKVQNPVGYAIELSKRAKNGTLTPIQANSQLTLSERLAKEKKQREEDSKRGAMDNPTWAKWFEAKTGVKPQI